jgi:hypothetical protein
LTVVHLQPGWSESSLRQQHPAFPVQIGGLRFSVDEADQADWFVAMQFSRRGAQTRVPRSRRILVVTEPDGHFPLAYINQFGLLVSPFGVPGFSGRWFQSHGALPAWFGRMLFSDTPPDMVFERLLALPVPPKRDAVSAVVSTKISMAGHRLRLRFLRVLAARLGRRLELYGRGIREISDKADAILPVKYHLVLENTVMPSYWTEKLADAFLGHALPLVAGPPDLERWFPPDSFVPIDLNDPEGAAGLVSSAIDRDLYAERQEAIAVARRHLLLDERLCPVLARAIASVPHDDTPRLDKPVTIRPVPRRGIPARFYRGAQRAFWSEWYGRTAVRDLRAAIK